MEKQTNVRKEMKEALYKRAMGYEVEETKVIVSNDGRPIRIEKTKRHIPPDLKAMIAYKKLFGETDADKDM